MPICNQSAMPVGNRKGTTEIDNHASEAAKVKRAREQAYFNSYNFDAIEVLPYEQDGSEADEDEDGGGNGGDGGVGVGSNKYVNGRSKTLMKLRMPMNQQSTLVAKNNGNILPQTAEETSSSSNVSSSGSGRSKSDKVVKMKYAYLQRLGAFFMNSHQTESHTEPSSPDSSESKVANIDNNFLLPRAMLKYQSSVGAANSMPLTVLMQQQHQQQQQQQQLQSQLQLQPQQHKNDMMMTSNAISLVNALLPIHGEHQQTRLGHEDTNTGFLTLPENLVTKKPLPRNKKQSTGSTTTSTASIASLELPSAAVTNAVAIGIGGTPSNTASATVKSTSTKTTTIVVIDSNRNTNLVNQMSDGSNSNSNSNLNLNSNINSGTGSGTGTGSSSATTPRSSLTPSTSITVETGETHRRANSHQSHYSTDKSGSSGYYSSNVCSTYSIEDHIYSEPVIDILDLNSKSKSGKTEAMFNTKRQQQQKQKLKQHQQLLHQQLPPLSGATTQRDETLADSQTRTMNGVGNTPRIAAATDDTEADEDEGDRKLPLAPVQAPRRKPQRQRQIPQNFNDKLRILETSIDNLDRHLKSFPSLSTQEHIVSFVQAHQHYLQHHELGEKLRLPYNQLLPTIMEGYDPANQPRPWQDDIADDSLLDIDLDSFLLTNETKDLKRINAPPAAKTTRGGGIDNPTFITDELEENNYKCAKYINSCPENAYHVESDIVATSESRGSASQKSMSAEHYLRRYEDQIHFQNTRELLEDVRDKIRILSQSSSDLHSSASDATNDTNSHNKPVTIIQQQQQQLPQQTKTTEVPKELENMIKTLKNELESYLDRMNQHSEYEIRQLCSGLVKNENIVKMKKAFERRRSVTEIDFYEPVPGEVRNGLIAFNAGVPAGIRQQLASIRCASDPNFKMKRKSLTEVFPAVSCYMESVNENRGNPSGGQTQLQRNLSFQKPVLNQLEPKMNAKQAAGIQHNNSRRTSDGNTDQTVNGKDSQGTGENGGDKDSILEWHRKKPSIWEMYYGTNRMHQSLLGKRNGMVVNVNQSSMSYPSSRPESDFTLDLPRAEQLRIKMEKEKKFRQRCRYITTFLSLVFFLLTVMVVSLVLTRGKRMFGSMI